MDASSTISRSRILTRERRIPICTYRSPLAFGRELTVPFKFIERTRTVSPRRSFSRKRLFRCGGFLNCQFLVYILDLAAQLGPLGFQFFIDAGRLGKLVDVADRPIGGVLRILKDLLSFLAGFGKHFSFCSEKRSSFAGGGSSAFQSPVYRRRSLRALFQWSRGCFPDWQADPRRIRPSAPSGFSPRR